MAVTESGHLASREIDDLYRAHVAEVYRYAYAVLGNHADAEDVTQTTFLNAYRSLEQGVRPRKPANWLLTIASNAIKQRFRQEQARPRQVEFDERIAHAGTDEDGEGPSVGELLTALSKIPPQQRQAIVLREFEGRSYSEIAEILGVTTSALETLLFRARRSLADELQHQLTCTEAQLAVSQSVDGRLGRKERRRLRDHLVECPDCAQFARLQKQHRSALRGLALVPIPLSLTLFKGLEGTASAAVVPISAGAGAVAVGAGAGSGATAAGTGGVLAGGLGLKVAAVVTAAGVAGGVGVAGSSELDKKPAKSSRPVAQQPGVRLGQVAPRGVTVPGNGVARGKATAPGQTKAAAKRQGSAQSQKAKAAARGQTMSAAKRKAAAERRATRTVRASTPTTRPPQSAGASAKKPTPVPKPSATTKERASAAETAKANGTTKANAGGPKER
jgi:RNA polymerase sigma factor (sigma-70 family)